MKTSQPGACSRLMCMSRSILSEFQYKPVLESFAPPQNLPQHDGGPPRTGCSNLLGPPPSFEHGALIFRGPVVSPDPGPHHSRNSKIHPKLSVHDTRVRKDAEMQTCVRRFRMLFWYALALELNTRCREHLSYVSPMLQTLKWDLACDYNGL